jgi:hypothetical protein
MSVREFLQQGGPKPHVVLRLVLNPRAVADGREWLGCRLSMDSLYALGVFYITLLRYAEKLVRILAQLLTIDFLFVELTTPVSRTKRSRPYLLGTL